MKIGISGCGAFADCFVPLFKAHPLVRVVAVADILPERAHKMASRYGLTETYASHEELCASDVDAIAIITQRHLHGPQSLEALRAGKDVYCAVPAASSVEDMQALVQAVEETGLIYMTGETSYYYPSALFCRQQYENGEMGDFVYGEGEYLHDMAHGFYEAFQHSGGDDWQKVAGFPPMFYPTHSTSMVVSTTGQHLTSVSCLGYQDRHDDGIFGPGKNHWDNPFSNQSALFRTSGGGICRVNEFRRVGHGAGNCVRASLYGTKGSFEEQGNALFWTTLDREKRDMTEELDCGTNPAHSTPDSKEGQQEDFFTGTAPIHPTERLPESFLGLPNGHYGSHQFLVDDFVRALHQRKLPPNHVWNAARYVIPGLIAHESAQREGESLAIPDLGGSPANAMFIDLSPY